MGAVEIVGWGLIAGPVIFLVGAGGWRLAYEQPHAEALPVIHADRRRRAWIHLWMLVAMLVTPASLAALAVPMAPGSAVALTIIAAVVYLLGAGCWIVSLVFRLTVVPWAAAEIVSQGRVPPTFVPLDAWAGALYVMHMASAYLAFALLGAAVLASEVLPPWLGWLGVGWGLVFLVGFVLTRFAGLFNPPFWAHLYPAVVGVTLLAT